MNQKSNVKQIIKKIVIVCMIFSIVCMCSCNKESKSELEKYITNYDEVVEALGEQFGAKELTIIDYELTDAEKKTGFQNMVDSSKNSIIENGTGNWYLSVNGIMVTVTVSNKLATCVIHANENFVAIVNYTRSYQEQLEKRIVVYD